MIPWDQKPCQGWVHTALLAQGRCWCNYVDLGANYDLVQGCADGVPLCWASLGWLWKGKHWWEIVLSFERKQRRQSCWRSSKLRFMLIKKFRGFFQLASTVNKSVKPLLLLTGCFWGQRLPMRKNLHLKRGKSRGFARTRWQKKKKRV